MDEDFIQVYRGDALSGYEVADALREAGLHPHCNSFQTTDGVRPIVDVDVWVPKQEAERAIIERDKLHAESERRLRFVVRRMWRRAAATLCLTSIVAVVISWRTHDITLAVMAWIVTWGASFLLCDRLDRRN